MTISNEMVRKDLVGYAHGYYGFVSVASENSSPIPLLHFREADAFPASRSDRLETLQCHSLHRRGDGGTHQAIKPVIVGSLRAKFPFVDRATTPFGFHSIFGGQVFGQQTMLVGYLSEE